VNTCEICQHPEDCSAGRATCDLSGEFHVPVPAEVANKLLDRLPTGDEAIYISEEAGWVAALGYWGVAPEEISDNGHDVRYHDAWSRWEPSEASKDKTR
jgi:hypothetical protein